MRWLLRSAGAAAAIVVVVLLIASIKPAIISISRSTVIHARAAVIFGLIDDFHNWPIWAPQDHEDTTMKRTYLGPAQGVGAISRWNSRGSAGTGEMTIAKSPPNSRVEVHVDFHAPFVAHNVNAFILEPAGNETRLTWSMQGTNIFVLKLMSVFVSPDRILGPHFEKGLAALKSAAEKRPARTDGQ